MKSIIHAIFVLAGISLFATGANAQCKSFAKKNCLPAMAPYFPEPSFNGAQFSPGDSASLVMTFSEDQDYRLLVCARPNLGKVHFVITDKQNNVLYDNAEHNFEPVYDFRVAGTQPLNIKVKVPEKTADNKLSASGCVALVIGTRQPPKEASAN